MIQLRRISGQLIGQLEKKRIFHYMATELGSFIRSRVSSINRSSTTRLESVR